jgi:hypothetical protein
MTGMDDVFGDFRICTFEPPMKNSPPTACVERATRMRTELAPGGFPLHDALPASAFDGVPE